MKTLIGQLLTEQSDLGLYCLNMAFCLQLWCSKFSDVYHWICLSDKFGGNSRIIFLLLQ